MYANTYNTYNAYIQIIILAILISLNENTFDRCNTGQISPQTIKTTMQTP